MVQIAWLRLSKAGNALQIARDYFRSELGSLRANPARRQSARDPECNKPAAPERHSALRTCPEQSQFPEAARHPWRPAPLLPMDMSDRRPRDSASVAHPLESRPWRGWDRLHREAARGF